MNPGVDVKLQDLIQAVHDTCPFIQAETDKLHNGRGTETSLPYIEQLVADLADALSKCTGNAPFGYAEGFDEGLSEGREDDRDESEEYDQGYDDGYEDGKQAGLDEATDDES